MSLNGNGQYSDARRGFFPRLPEHRSWRQAGSAGPCPCARCVTDRNVRELKRQARLERKRSRQISMAAKRFLVDLYDGPVSRPRIGAGGWDFMIEKLEALDYITVGREDGRVRPVLTIWGTQQVEAMLPPAPRPSPAPSEPPESWETP